MGNCDSFLFLGGNDQESLSYISKMTGKATIDTITRGETKGRGGSSSRNFQNTGRELVTPEELRMVDRDALLLIRGECPVMDRKYDLNRHPNIRYTEMAARRHTKCRRIIAHCPPVFRRRMYRKNGKGNAACAGAAFGI